jgi:hypothetical protein
MHGLTQKQITILVEMLLAETRAPGAVTIIEPKLLASLVEFDLVQQLGERRGCLTPRGATMARSQTRAA